MDGRECTQCNEWKPREDMCPDKRSKSGMAAWCKACHNSYCSKKYKNDPEFRQRYLEKHTKRRERRNKPIQDYKVSKGCSQCGFKGHPVALHMDHRDPETKNPKLKKGVSWWQLSDEEIEEEKLKCDVLCANCHAIKGYENNDFSSKKY